MKETDRQMKETYKRFGEVVEYRILPNLVAKFDELGFTFTKANRTEITNRGIFFRKVQQTASTLTRL
jgi:hypothetical protein